jgi:hypothetical protein
MQAFNNDPKLKEALLREIRKHEKADAIIKGTYGKTEGGKWKGCAVGCTLKSLNIIKKEDGSTSSHARYEDIGIPRAIARLEDAIFERLAEPEGWPFLFLKTIPVGANLSMVVTEFLLWLMEDKEGIIKHARPDGRKAIKTVAKLLKRKLKGDNPTSKEWEEAHAAAAAAADAAADAAAYAGYAADAAAAAYAGYAAAAYAGYAADAYAGYAADAAADAAAAAAAAAAKQDYAKKMAEKLLELLRKA